MIKKYPFPLESDLKKELNEKVKSYLNCTYTTENVNITILNEYPDVLYKLKKVLERYVDTNIFNFNLAKSWGCLNTVNTPDTRLHGHGYCHFGFVFYTAKNETSNIVFKDLNNLEFEVKASENEIIVFPGYLMHYIRGGNTEDRISFAGDILVTYKETPEQNYSEYLTPIQTWIQL